MNILLLLWVLVPVLDCQVPLAILMALLESRQGAYAFLVLESPKLLPVSTCGLTSAK